MIGVAELPTGNLNSTESTAYTVRSPFSVLTPTRSPSGSRVQLPPPSKPHSLVPPPAPLLPLPPTPATPYVDTCTAPTPTPTPTPTPKGSQRLPILRPCPSALNGPPERGNLTCTSPSRHTSRPALALPVTQCLVPLSSFIPHPGCTVGPSLSTQTRLDSTSRDSATLLSLPLSLSSSDPFILSSSQPVLSPIQPSETSPRELSLSSLRAYKDVSAAPSYASGSHGSNKAATLVPSGQR